MNYLPGQLIELITGKQAFLFNGHTYYKKYRLSNGVATRWACSRSSKCAAYVHLDDHLKVIYVSTKVHTHPPATFVLTQKGKYAKV